jgi:hypothetical protein
MVEDDFVSGKKCWQQAYKTTRSSDNEQKNERQNANTSAK